MARIEQPRPSEKMYAEAHQIMRDCEERMMDLRNFDPETGYGLDLDRELVYERFDRKRQMDEMTVLMIVMKHRGASLIELACVVKHAMVIFETKDKVLDWRQSENDNDIPYLKEKYMYEAALSWIGEHEGGHSDWKEFIPSKS